MTNRPKQKSEKEFEVRTDFNKLRILKANSDRKNFSSDS